MDHANLKRAILQTSLELGTELGEEGLTMRAIARRLGVSATALYQHFDSKAAIMGAIRMYGLGQLHTSLAPSFELGDPVEVLRDHSLRYLSFARANPWLYNTLMEGEEIDWVAADEEETAFVMQSTVRFVQVLERGLEAGRMRPDLDVKMTPWMFWAALHGLAQLMLRGRVTAEGPSVIQGDIEEISRGYVDGLVRGFLV